MAIKQNKDGSYEIVPDPDPFIDFATVVVGLHMAVGAVALGVHHFGDESLRKLFFETSKPVPSEIECQNHKPPVQDISVITVRPK